jgi:hypothetical protein
MGQCRLLERYRHFYPVYTGRNFRHVFLP